MEELGAEGDVPVGVIFEDQSRGEAVVDDTVIGVRIGGLRCVGVGEGVWERTYAQLACGSASTRRWRRAQDFR